MRNRWVLSLAGALVFAACGDDDDDDDRPVVAATGEVRNFGPAPLEDCINSEGVAVDDQGNIWTASAPDAGGDAGATANVCKLNQQGQVVSRFTVNAGGSGRVNFGGLLFVPNEGLYLTDFGDFNAATGNKRLLRMDPATGAVTAVDEMLQSPNAITRDTAGDLYVSDSAGFIYRYRGSPRTRDATPWSSDPALQTDNSNLPFGANGLAFDATEQFLYVANTGESQILRVRRNPNGTAGAVEPVASRDSLGGDALFGADGIAFDTEGNLYVCANQAGQIQVLQVAGAPAITQRFAGEGTNTFVFPASIAFRGNQAYIANLSFGTRGGKLSIIGTPIPGLAIP